MYKLIAIGNLGKDAESRTIDSGDTAISFSIATEVGTSQNPKTQWTSCTYWRKAGQSQSILQYLKKGTKVCIEGTPRIETYTTRDGGTGTNMQVNVLNIELLGGNQQGGQESQPQQQAANPAATVPNPAQQRVVAQDDDDLPF